MVYGKTVEVEPKDTDRYGRTVALISVDGQSLNEALLKNGFPGPISNIVTRRFVRIGLTLKSLPDTAKSV